MTIPTERYNSILRTEKLLCKLMIEKKLSQELRDEVRACLKHYPSEFYMDMIAEKAPEWVEKPKKVNQNG